MERSSTVHGGFTLVEIVIGASIILIFVSALSVSLSFFVSVLPERTNYMKASMLAAEGIEAVKQMRNTSWDTSIAASDLDSPYYLLWAGNMWQLSETQNTVDGTFVRTITFEEVYRDGNDDIAASGTLDAGARKVTALVTWDGGAHQEEVITYLTNLFDN